MKSPGDPRDKENGSLIYGTQRRATIGEATGS
jgi:hypothetical protein